MLPYFYFAIALLQLGGECVAQEDFSTETVEMTGTTDFLSQPAALTEEVQLVMDPASLGNRTIQSTETVTVETTQTVDPTEVSLDEFVVMDNPIPGTTQTRLLLCIQR
jgi:hypothetical protein